MATNPQIRQEPRPVALWNVRPDDVAGYIFQERFGEEVLDVFRATRQGEG